MTDFRSKTDVTLLSVVRFGQIKTRWKDNFVIFGILSVLDIKEKIHEVKAAPKGDKEGDSDEAKGCLGQVFYK
jgi:hypothetical protein